jgi:phenylacetate-CoA ligase
MTSSQTLLTEAFARVPAYRAFLSEHGAGPETPWDALPLITKKNYLLTNEVADLCWDGTVEGCHVIGASSGFSRAGSVFWPKRPKDEGAYAEAIERMLVERFAIDQRRTLIFVCLAFGTWFAGMQIATAMRSLAASGRYPVTVALPSLNLREAVEIYRRFGSAYQQVVWITNPSNVSLIAALLERDGITPPPGTIAFPVVGEYFSEGFREHVAERFGYPQDAPFCVFTGYGSADAGGLGDETAATIALRKHIFHRPALSETLFGTKDTPMLLTPMPGVLLECIDGRIVVSKDVAIPLIRYDTGDAGGLMTRAELAAAIDDLPPELLAALPETVLYVFGRASDAIIFYGTNLMIQDINRHFLALPQHFGYGGLFEVKPCQQDGVTSFAFTVYADGADDAARRAAYADGLIAFLKGHSLEFAAKYDPLCASLGAPLITVTLADPATLPARTKHRFIVEA